MIPDVDVPHSDGWWLKRLMNGFNARPLKPPSKVGESRRHLFTRREWLDLLWSYNIGEAPLPTVSQSHRETTRAFLRMARANYGQLAVEGLMDRVQLAGLRTGADDDADGDDIVRAMIETNGAWLSDALGFTFAMGEGLAFIGPGDEPGTALITAEDPRQAIVERDPVRPYVVRAALKTYRDEVERADMAHLFLPAGEGDGPNNDRDRVRIAVRATGNSERFLPKSWEWVDDSRSGPLKVQGLGVPVVPFTNRLGMGEYEPHLDLLDRINNMIADRLWTAKLQAYRQRALRAKEKDTPPMPDTDEHGNKIDLDELFAADPGALWELPPGYDIWESQETTLQPILMSVRDDVREFSAVTRTPLSMFAPEGENQSAAGAESADDGLVFKAEDRHRRLTPSVLRTYRIALAYAGHADRAKDMKPIWAPARRLTLPQRATAASAGKNSGLPLSAVLTECWQFDPPTVARILAEVRAEQARALFTRPAAPPQGQAPQGEPPQQQGEPPQQQGEPNA